MKRSIIFGLLFILFANSVFAANLSAQVQATLKNAGVTDSQLNQIESSISTKQYVTKEELNEALKDAGVTPEQMASINSIASGQTEASIATAGAGTTGGTGTVGTVALSVGISLLVGATAIGLNNALNGSKTKIHPVATTGT